MTRHAILSCELVQQGAMLGIQRAALRDALSGRASAEIVGERREEFRLVAIVLENGFSRLDGR